MTNRNKSCSLFWMILVLAGQGYGCPQGQCASAQLSERRYIQVGEFKRAYRQHLPPAYDGTKPLPLVFVFHGRSEGAKDIAEITGFNDLADRYNAVVVYPIGIREHWNDGRVAVPILGAGNYDDVGFIKALLEHLQATLAIDPQRIYATGMSNGGMFVQRLACELPEAFAAIAPVAGTLPTNIAAQCTPAKPVSIIEFHGTKDAYVHWAGGSVRAIGGQTLSVPQTIDHWQRLDGCPSTPEVTYHPKDHLQDLTLVRRETSRPCRDNSEVVLYAVEGGGHTWPGGPSDHSLPFLGQVTQAVSATELIWAFFEQHPKPGRTATTLVEHVPAASQNLPQSDRPPHLLQTTFTTHELPENSGVH